MEFLGGNEDEEGSVEVLLLLEMEEKMEGRMVEELVEEMVVEMEGDRPKKEARWLAWLLFSFAGNGEERRKKK